MQEKVGRNDRCPCGSGKKYKWCCGKATPEPLTLPKTFPKCAVCGSERLFCEEAMKPDVQLVTLGNRRPALFSFEFIYDTPLYPIKLIAVGDVCVDCGMPRVVALDKVRGKPQLPGQGGRRGPLIRPM